MSGAAIEGARAACRASGMHGVASAARSMRDACDVCDGGDPGPAHDATTMSVVPARRRRGSRAAYAMMSETRTIGGGAKRAGERRLRRRDARRMRGVDRLAIDVMRGAVRTRRMPAPRRIEPARQRRANETRSIAAAQAARPARRMPGARRRGCVRERREPCPRRS
ncbi:hypothetical protein AQ949_20710 [Burkholderia pseudomallei]|uniref:Uncharacterized protein n=1 Tax=Burkholderia pseudomallei (strain 1106a) TaxID=357348 RepID=A3NV49_BURP0|nr:hypothetical protein BURPS1106A_1955 [Burkholderia pseudomallei 1106a]AJW53133.1 hypothetical protein UQ47_08710 [Burkholderia pseudomallei]EES23958.1 hypothetical protein BURPS1106B_A1192 [Burkholderia pseudomallei 1106b]EIF81137.1 hypothetical protein BP354A_1651 [Burkholderia pseudomallei 354a]ALB93743.1 hypothetical protein AM256_09020 [Burkholderia pseudomallei]